MNKSKLLVVWIILLALLFFIGCTPTRTVNEPVQSGVTQNNKQVAEPAKDEPKMETKDGLKVHFIDVGQGASQLIIGSTGKTILIDAGNNNQAAVVCDYLKKQKISKIDILVGTHPDADHIGGLDAVIDNFEIGKIYLPKVQANTKTFEDVLLAIQRKGLKVSTAKAGLTLDWEADAAVQMLAPTGEHPDDTNDMSAVIHLDYGDTSFLFTGDAELKSEHEMIDAKVNLKSDVLLVGHHGSKSSTSQAFLEAVRPSYAVIQVGKSNNYGHPSAEVLNRLADGGIKTFRNDEQGNIVFSSNGKEIVVNYNNGVTVPIKGQISPTSTTNQPTVKHTEAARQKDGANVVYNNCSQVRTAGKAPLHRDDPGYSTKLDRDKDGVACE
jgi:competence protein ComEC